MAAILTKTAPPFLSAVRRELNLLAWLLVAGVFLLDMQLPEGTAVGLLYVVVLLLGLWTPRPRDVLHVAGFATLLSLVEYGLTPVENAWGVNFTNHVLQVVVLWITAFGVNLFRRTLQARERAEQKAKASEATLREQATFARIGKMAAVVAHEVRNPLAGIRGAVQVIGGRFGPEAPEQRIAGEIVTRIDTLSDIVNDLLEFARPRQPVLMATSLRPLLSTTTILLRDDPALADVSVDVSGDDVVLTADPELLKLVLLNLLINSAQAMAGRGRIIVTARIDNAWHEIRIADEGPGIPVDARAHLFEPFFTTKHRGTGLGLATARRLMEAHGGSLDLTWPPQGGTTAILRLPRALTRA